MLAVGKINFNNKFPADTYLKHTIGVVEQVDKMFTICEDIVKTNQSYPPHNIIKISDTDSVIELALAGFSMDSIEITLEKNILYVKGRDEEAHPKQNYIYRGIAARAFTKAFTLSDDVQITGASMSNGLLTIACKRVVVDQSKSKKIPISMGNR